MEYLLFNVKVLLQCEAIRYNIIVYHRTITLPLLWPLFNILWDTTLVYDSGWSLPAWVARQMIEPCLCINIFHYQLKNHFACIFISMQSHLFQFIDSGFVEQNTSLSAFHFFWLHQHYLSLPKIFLQTPFQCNKGQAKRINEGYWKRQ